MAVKEKKEEADQQMLKWKGLSTKRQLANNCKHRNR